MSSEVITLQVGQCGNQVGLEYWNQMALDFGLAPDGTPQPYKSDELAFETDSQAFSQKPPLNVKTFWSRSSPSVSRISILPDRS